MERLYKTAYNPGVPTNRQAANKEQTAFRAVASFEEGTSVTLNVLVDSGSQCEAIVNPRLIPVSVTYASSAPKLFTTAKDNGETLDGGSHQVNLDMRTTGMAEERAVPVNLTCPMQPYLLDISEWDLLLEHPWLARYGLLQYCNYRMCRLHAPGSLYWMLDAKPAPLANTF